MATTIVFAAPRGDQSLTVTVEEDVGDVFRACTRAGGLPFALTESGRSKREVWINPVTVAYWHETRSGSVSA